MTLFSIVDFEALPVNSSSGSCLPGYLRANEKEKARSPGLFDAAVADYLRNTLAFIGMPFDNAEWKYSRLFIEVLPWGTDTARTDLKQPS